MQKYGYKLLYQTESSYAGSRSGPNSMVELQRQIDQWSKAGWRVHSIDLSNFRALLEMEVPEKPKK